MIAVFPCCLRSFVFDVGLTTGGVEIGLSLITISLYTDFCVISIDKLHKHQCNLLCDFYIDFCVILCYNTDNGEGQLFYKPQQEGGTTMPIVYKIDILAALKEAGYNTNRLRKEKLLSEGVIQSLRENKYIALQNISKICELLDCQPADLLVYEKES